MNPNKKDLEPEMSIEDLKEMERLAEERSMRVDDYYPSKRNIRRARTHKKVRYKYKR